MSYAIYKTEAIVLRVIPQGEANIDVVFFTREFGKITARVQSARKIESKMRMHLTRYAHVVIDLVRGKVIWRLTGISDVASYATYGNAFFLKSLHRVFRLAEFLIQGEEPHSELFLLFMNLLNYSQEFVSSSFGKREGEGLEIFGVLKILEKLGYGSADFLSDVPDKDSIVYCIEHRKELVKSINESISATQIVL